MSDIALLGYALQRFVTARWKALMPFIAYGISVALASKPLHLDTPADWKAFAMTAASAAFVYAKSNRATK